MKARAERQQETRTRIIAATVALHREVGPARTTIADIARRAGVQRLTVYSNFPDPRDLFEACQGHFLAQNPPPDISVAGDRDPLRRLEERLTDLYGWYRSERAMERNVHRDRHLIPALDAVMADTLDARLAAVAADHARAITGTAEAPQRPLIRLALEFRTWELLAQEGLGDAEIARLFAGAIAAADRG
jgi:AcrR family transcriptional regulator